MCAIGLRTVIGWGCLPISDTDVEGSTGDSSSYFPWCDSETILKLSSQQSFISHLFPTSHSFPAEVVEGDRNSACPHWYFFLWNDIVISFTTCSYYLPEGSFYEADTLFKVLPEQMHLKWQVRDGLLSVKQLGTQLPVKWHRHIHQLSEDEMRCLPSTNASSAVSPYGSQMIVLFVGSHTWWNVTHYSIQGGQCFSSELVLNKKMKRQWAPLCRDLKSSGNWQVPNFGFYSNYTLKTIHRI